MFMLPVGPHAERAGTRDRRPGRPTEPLPTVVVPPHARNVRSYFFLRPFLGLLLPFFPRFLAAAIRARISAAARGERGRMCDGRGSWSRQRTSGRSSGMRSPLSMAAAGQTRPCLAKHALMRAHSSSCSSNLSEGSVCGRSHVSPAGIEAEDTMRRQRGLVWRGRSWVPPR